MYRRESDIALKLTKTYTRPSTKTSILIGDLVLLVHTL